MQDKTIFLASDHGGANLKNHLRDWLKAQGYDIEDLGTDSPNISVDYPDEAESLVQKIKENPKAFGILICTTGVGMSIAANRYPFVRGALVMNTDMAQMCRAHNNANVLIFGAKYVDEKLAEECTKIFLNTEFDGGRHARRVDKLTCLGEKK